MQIHTKEHYDVIEAFERIFGQKPHYMPIAKEAKDNWPRGYIYTNSVTNELFKAFRQGVSYAKAEYQS